MRTVIVDNYDSFTYNLYQYVGQIEAPPLVFRNDRVTLEQIAALRPDRILLSPGPGNPENPAYFGVCRRVLLELGPTVPILGICLGHQGICSAFGGRVTRAPRVMHGKASPVFHDGSALYSGIPTPFPAMRYHSLVAEPGSLPGCLVVTARTEEGVIMGVRHREFPIHGVQFHPESIGTPSGRRLIGNFLSPEASPPPR